MLSRLSILLCLAIGALAVQRYTVKDGTKTCLILEADIEGDIVWQNVNGTKNETKTYHWSLEKPQEITGNCGAKSAKGDKANTLEVTFSPANPGSPRYDTVWKFTLELSQKENKTYELSDWSLMFAARADLPYTDTYKKTTDASIDLSAAEKNAYKCSSVGLAMNFGSVMRLKSVKALAFVNLDGDDFPKGQVYEVCKLDARTSDIVPIIVGACLAGLVVVVLVAYLVGRARAKRQGYASV